MGLVGDGFLHISDIGDVIEVGAGSHQGTKTGEEPEIDAVRGQQAAKEGGDSQTQQAPMDGGKFIADVSPDADAGGAQHHAGGVEQLHQAGVPGGGLEMVAGHQGIEGGKGQEEDHA